MKSNFEIMSLSKGVTERGSNYFDIEAVNKTTGEQVKCVYFGNTTPKRLIDIVIQKSKDGEKEYSIAVIQPHTSRDRKTGRFVSAYRTC